MWYRFSKLSWFDDMTDGIEYTYAYASADTKEDAIKKVNESSIPRRKYTDRGMDQIDEVGDIPMKDIDKVII
jgi:hypothetical protein